MYKKLKLKKLKLKNFKCRKILLIADAENNAGPFASKFFSLLSVIFSSRLHFNWKFLWNRKMIVKICFLFCFSLIIQYFDLTSFTVFTKKIFPSISWIQHLSVGLANRISFSATKYTKSNGWIRMAVGARSLIGGRSPRA